MVKQTVETGDFMLTQTLDPRRFTGSFLEQLTLSYMELRYTILDVCNEFDCWIELTKKGNVHYHCILYECNLKRFRKWHHRFALIGFYKTKPIHNMEGAIAYCCKTQEDVLQMMRNSHEEFHDVRFPLQAHTFDIPFDLWEQYC